MGRWPYCSRCAKDLGPLWGFHVWFPQRAVDRFTDWLWLR
jgi:hypothetical protein